MNGKRIDRLKIEDEVENILESVPRSVYADEETVALAALLRPVYDRYLNDTRPPGRVLKLVSKTNRRGDAR